MRPLRKLMTTWAIFPDKRARAPRNPEGQCPSFRTQRMHAGARARTHMHAGARASFARGEAHLGHWARSHPEDRARDGTCKLRGDASPAPGSALAASHRREAD